MEWERGERAKRASLDGNENTSHFLTNITLNFLASLPLPPDRLKMRHAFARRSEINRLQKKLQNLKDEAQTSAMNAGGEVDIMRQKLNKLLDELNEKETEVDKLNLHMKKKASEHNSATNKMMNELAAMHEKFAKSEKQNDEKNSKIADLREEMDKLKVSERSERALMKTSIRATTKLTLFHSIRIRIRTFFARRRGR